MDHGTSLQKPKGYLQKTIGASITIALVVAVSVTAAMSFHWLDKEPTNSSGAIRSSALAPFTVVLVEKVRHPDGRFLTMSRQIHALRSDGSKVFSFDSLNSSSSNPFARRRISLASGADITLDDVRELKTTMRLNPSAIGRALRNPATKCTRALTGEVPPIDDQVGGIETVGEYRVITIKTKQRLTMRFALDLSCAPLGHLATYSETSYSSLDPVEIRPGEPDAALFHVPEHYKEVPPSTMETLDPQSAAGKRRDATYETFRF